MIKVYSAETLTREALEQSVKLRVIDEEHSKAFQRAVLDLGVDWFTSEGEAQYTDKPYLYVNWTIRYGEKESTFLEERTFQEIYFDDGRGIFSSDDPQEGVSLRDYFAGMALQGSLASPANEGMTPDHLAEWAYSLADAMLKARKE